MKPTEKEIEIFSKHCNGDEASVRFKDLPSGLLPEDEIHIVRDPGYYSENNSYDAYTELKIIRVVPKTEEELQKDCIRHEEHMKELKQNRYQRYLVLKKEFENEKNTDC